MTDKDILRTAARAEGTINEFNAWKGEDSSLETSAGLVWNPLSCAGQRYDLAKKLDMQINFELQYVKFYAGGGYENVISWPDDAADDAYAIVMAAAVIGASL